jgi:alpha,alpha-trehalose phosphorylase
MTVETARLWIDAGDFLERADGLTASEMQARLSGGLKSVPESPKATALRTVFCINTVTGPDEYTPLVNNNVYTNLMARANLVWAVDLLNWMRKHAKAEFNELSERLELSRDEIANWTRASELMFVPYDFHRNLYPQDESFFNKAIWPIKEIPREKRPLLLHYHPLVIYRYQILKQPDLVLAQFLQSELFTVDERRANFDYYEPLTTGDSSLSHCIQSIVAVQVGDVEKGWNYFKKTARMDLDDLHGNVGDGIHCAAMAGSWLSIVYGFGGFREHIVTGESDGALPQRIRYSFSPTIPSGLNELRFRLRFAEALVEIGVSRTATSGLQVEYRLIEGPLAEFCHRTTAVVLDTGNSDCRFKEGVLR